MTPTEPSCASCRHAAVEYTDEGDPNMVCRRYPPVLFVVDGEPVQTFLTIDADMVCGEWARPAVPDQWPPLQPGVPTVDLLEPRVPTLGERLAAWWRARRQ